MRGEKLSVLLKRVSDNSETQVPRPRIHCCLEPCQVEGACLDIVDVCANGISLSVA